eukprot:1469843-Rhodomonas_salina.1
MPGTNSARMVLPAAVRFMPVAADPAGPLDVSGHSGVHGNGNGNGFQDFGAEGEGVSVAVRQAPLSA